MYMEISFQRSEDCGVQLHISGHKIRFFPQLQQSGELSIAPLAINHTAFKTGLRRSAETLRQEQTRRSFLRKN